jgi:hypothetical protein
MSHDPTLHCKLVITGCLLEHILCRQPIFFFPVNVHSEVTQVANLVHLFKPLYIVNCFILDNSCPLTSQITEQGNGS